MTDERLRDELRALPRRRATEGFTGRVLDRLDEPGRRSLWLPATLAGAAATAALLLLAVALGLPEPGGDEASGTWAPGPVARLTPAPATVADVPGPESPAGGTGQTDLDRAQRLLAELRAEHAQVEDSWRTLRRLAREAEPVLYVGGTDGADMVVDLRRVEDAGTHLRVTPAATRRASDMIY